MYKLISIAVVLVLISVLSVSATALAKGKPSSGSVVTFDSGTTSSTTHVEDGVTVRGFQSIVIFDTDGDGDKELDLKAGGGNTIFKVDLGGSVFDLTSFDIDRITDLTDGGISVISSEGDSATITNLGTITLNWSGITGFKVTVISGKVAVDNIVINGDGKTNNGKKSGKTTCLHDTGHGTTKINVNGNSVDAHRAHGDKCLTGP